MSPGKIIDNPDLSIDEINYQQDSSDNSDKDLDKKYNAETRKRIDELLEKKRLKELLDEDEWEL